MEKRNYPAERKQAPTWECPICSKTMSARGKAGHMEKLHRQILPPKENCPYSFRHRPLVQMRRPLASYDVRKMIAIINLLQSDPHDLNDILLKRKRFLQCEYVFRELEIQFNCSLKEALAKFPELGYE